MDESSTNLMLVAAVLAAIARMPWAAVQAQVG
jgi:hypothetical protein